MQVSASVGSPYAGPSAASQPGPLPALRTSRCAWSAPSAARRPRPAPRAVRRGVLAAELVDDVLHPVGDLDLVAVLPRSTVRGAAQHGLDLAVVDGLAERRAGTIAAGGVVVRQGVVANGSRRRLLSGSSVPPSASTPPPTTASGRHARDHEDATGDAHATH